MTIKTKQRAAEITRRSLRLPIQDLRPHPAYERLLGQPPAAAVDRRYENLRYSPAVRLAVEALPDGSVLAGYECVVAARKAGWEELEVVVLDGLDGAPAAVVEAQVIDAAVHSDCHGRMAKLRCLERALQIGPDVPQFQRPYYYKDDLVTNAVKLLGRKRRSVQHFVAVLKAPRQVQDALDAQAFDVHTAKAVAALPEAEKEKITRAIEEGGVPAKVVASHLPARPRRHQDVLKARDAYVRDLERHHPDLEDRLDKVTWVTAEQHRTLLKEQALVKRLLGQCKVVDTSRWAAAAERAKAALPGRNMAKAR